MKVVITRGYTWEEGKMAPTPLPLLSVWEYAEDIKVEWGATAAGVWDYTVDARLLMSLKEEDFCILCIPTVRGGQAVIADLTIISSDEQNLQENKWGRKNG